MQNQHDAGNANAQFATTTTTASEPVVNRIAVKVPPFWPERPEIWFAQVEAQFGIAGITTDASKFNTIVAAIESNVLAQIADAILLPPETGKYEYLKRCIVERFCDSEAKKIQKLLSDIDLGDRKPSQLLNELSSLAKDRVSGDFLKTLWLQRLPPHVRAILQTSEVELPALAKLADKILEVSDFKQICAANTTSVRQVADDTDISQRITRIEKRLEQIASKPKQRNRSSSRRADTSGRSVKPVNASNDVVCWYHHKFGDNAQKCRSPCKYPKHPKN